jgi:hypothetical protein
MGGASSYTCSIRTSISTSSTTKTTQRLLVVTLLLLLLLLQTLLPPPPPPPLLLLLVLLLLLLRRNLRQPPRPRPIPAHTLFPALSPPRPRLYWRRRRRRRRTDWPATRWGIAPGPPSDCRQGANVHIQ